MKNLLQELCRLLSRAPDIAATIELVIRRCYYQQTHADFQSKTDQVSKEVRDGTMNHQFISIEQEASASQEISSSQPPLVIPVDPPISLDPTSVEPPSSEEIRAYSAVHSDLPDHSNASPKDIDVTCEDSNAICKDSNATCKDLNVALSDPNISLRESNTLGAGFYLTAYVTGFGDSNHQPHPQWAIAISLLQHALMQLNRI